MCVGCADHTDLIYRKDGPGIDDVKERYTTNMNKICAYVQQKYHYAKQ